MKKNLKRVGHWLLCACLMIVSGMAYADVNPKPFVIPELQSWTGAEGEMSLSGVVCVKGGNKELMRVAKAFAADYEAMFGKSLTVKSGSPKAGDILFVLKKGDKALGKEGYRMNIDKYVTVTAATTQGAFWATRTLLQMSEQKAALPKGETVDVPVYELRGFMVDVGRKFMPIDYLNDLVKVMAYYKMNALQVHLNDNGFRQFFGNDWDKTPSGFRLESTLHPGLTSKDGHYTKQEFIDLQIFDTIRTMFFRALGALIIPMIFFSVVTTIAGLSSLSDTGRLGGKAMRAYMTTTVMAIIVGFATAFLLLPRKLPDAVHNLAEGSASGETAEILGRETLINLIPKDLVAPIQDANVFQVMLVAVFIGVALGILGDKIQVVNKLIEDMTNLFQILVNMVAAVMPLVTLAATASLMINVGLPVIPLLLQLIVAEAIAVGVMWIIYSIQLGLAGLSPVPFWRALPAYFRKSGLPNYSGAYLPYSMELCTRTFGVSPRVTSFTTSLGATINMDGACVHFVLCSVLFARLYGVALGPDMIITIALAVFILSMGDSAVQNSSIISMTSILTMMGVPTSALGLILGVDAILDMFRCGSNIIGDLSTTITIGKSEGEMDVEKYKTKPAKPAA